MNVKILDPAKKKKKIACEIHYLCGGECCQSMRQKVLPKERLLGGLNEWGMRNK